MIVAHPRVEEYTAGHIGRLRILNGAASSVELIRNLDRRYATERKKWHPTPVHRLIANLLQEDPEEYVKRHSLLPFDRLAYFDRDTVEDFNVAASARPRTTLWPLRKYAHFCPLCIEQDHAVLGFSYWRRIHQIPGIDRCDQHHIPLSFVTRNTAFDLPPDAWRAQAHVINDDRANLVNENPMVNGYSEIVRRLLADPRRVSRFSASVVVRELAVDHGLRVGTLGVHPTLSDFMKAHLPASWVYELYPAMLEREEGKYFWPIDGACLSQPVSGQTYAVALALLAKNPEEALKRLFAHPDEMPTVEEKRVAQNTSRRRVYLRAYIEHQGNHAAMARALQIDVAGLNVRLRKLGLPSLHFLDGQSRSCVLNFFRSASVESVQAWAEKMRQLLQRQPDAKSSISSWREAGLLSFA
ncbi:MAG TPA: TniQ family protein [Noviherbaspirillum sp.]|uniref:TniQ family protein n=1 Tax=Noviherbaspirillum sp. TaxID=1926288 RepID=UPI002B465FCF|nr:TniQ family protein [Noviherbaspirillum sp.]HJV87898.1 TniQ family protein [Noviherbaspirillum sp.]